MNTDIRFAEIKPVNEAIILSTYNANCGNSKCMTTAKECIIASQFSETYINDLIKYLTIIENSAYDLKIIAGIHIIQEKNNSEIHLVNIENENYKYTASSFVTNLRIFMRYKPDKHFSKSIISSTNRFDNCKSVIIQNKYLKKFRSYMNGLWEGTWTWINRQNGNKFKIIKSPIKFNLNKMLDIFTLLNVVCCIILRNLQQNPNYFIRRPYIMACYIILQATMYKGIANYICNIRPYYSNFIFNFCLLYANRNIYNNIRQSYYKYCDLHTFQRYTY